MADTSAVLKIQDVVDRHLFKYKLSKDDYVIYQEHAYDCYRNLNLFHSKLYKQEKITTNTLGIVSMPSDLEEIIMLAMPWNGMMWSITRRKDMITTTSTVGGSEVFDTDYGEGLSHQEDVSVSYGAHGGLDEYYYKEDWDSRRIFIDGLISSQITLVYISSGLDLTGDTYVPAKSIPVFDTYLRLEQSKFDNLPATQQGIRLVEYKDAIMMFRRPNIPSATEFRNQLRRMYVQSPLRR